MANYNMSRVELTWNEWKIERSASNRIGVVCLGKRHACEHVDESRIYAVKSCNIKWLLHLDCNNSLDILVKPNLAIHIPANMS